ncbi:uncharacterized protein METZ01_LOCUS502352, partial [marine metagenome]
YRVVRRELEAYGADLSTKSEIIGLNKCDALNKELTEKMKDLLEKETKKPVLAISGVAKTGLDDALRLLLREINSQQQ